MTEPGPSTTNDALSSSSRRGVTSGRRPDAVVGGVASELGARWRVDPLWIRLAFVALAVFDVLGFVAYAGLWLVLRGLRKGLFTLVGLVGLAVLVLGVRTIGTDGPTRLFDDRWLLVAALAGVAVALWQPRGVPAPTGAVSAPPPPPAPWPPPSPVDAPATPSVPTTAEHRSAVRRRPDPLGWWTLAVAVLVAAGGAVIDEGNGGRLHPEQWLGAAAAVCGLGILVSAFRGRAVWLVLPALVFAGSGFVAGHGARIGATGLDVGSEHYALWPGAVSIPDSERLVAGSFRVDVHVAPPAPVAPELAVGLGTIEIFVADDVAVEVRARVRSGSLALDGVDLPDADEWQTLRLGAEAATPDVVVTAEVSLGAIWLHTVDRFSGMPRELERGDGEPAPLREGTAAATETSKW